MAQPRQDKLGQVCVHYRLNKIIPNFPTGWRMRDLTKRDLCGEVKIGEKMYAIIESGGKQYKAVPGGTIEVDRLHVDEGTEIELDQVLLVSNDSEISIGTPTVDGALVKATVLEHFKGRKILVFKYKPRIRYRRKIGHRQQYTRLKINEIMI